MTRPNPSSPKSELLRTIRTVAWGLLGVRGHKPQDAPLSPWRIVITALVFMLVFVLVLVMLAIQVSRP